MLYSKKVLKILYYVERLQFFVKEKSYAGDCVNWDTGFCADET